MKIQSQSVSTIKFLFNENPSMVKNFKTINFEGSIPNKYNKVTVGQENTDVMDFTKPFHINCINLSSQGCKSF